ncbi:DNA primase TraC [Neolewinella maritima]|uniref:DNA primase TraC n=1 Tax=Neolewinella maritima TaxID=1383882 RepID=A0ABM9B6C7_9BACT|nr:zincin-like metallopeptidase domain-containing protein [Neolewinella maritima]CAH1002527.1 DNA primase TraC [Neolewinella maritima]
MANVKGRKATKSAPVDRYQQITDRVIAALESGLVPWQSPVGSANQKFAYNYVSGNEYRGINFFLLNFMRSHVQGAYLTFKQAKTLGGNIRKGAKSERVYFFKMYYRDEDGNGLSERKAQEIHQRGGKVKATPFLKSFPVFNVEDVEGIDFDLPQVETFDHTPIEQAEKFVFSITDGPTLATATGSANFYTPGMDTITMFPGNRYRTPEDYYSTLFHELTHATGHANRLNREGVTEAINPTSERYAREELTAEMGAAFLCALTGIEGQVDNSAAYIGTWLQRLKDDKTLVYKAAAQAQKATDWLKGVR